MLLPSYFFNCKTINNLKKFKYCIITKLLNNNSNKNCIENREYICNNISPVCKEITEEELLKVVIDISKRIEKCRGLGGGLV